LGNQATSGVARLKLNPEKCQLIQKEVRYLRHILLLERISTDPEKLRIVRELPTLKKEHEIRSILAYASITDGLLLVSPTLRNR
jgi:hypothetical protein